MRGRHEFAGAGAGQRGHDVGGACWHAAALGGGICRGVAARGRQAFSVVARVGLTGRDSATSILSTSMASAVSWAPSAFAPFPCRRREGSQGPPTSRRSFAWEDQERMETRRCRPRHQSLGRPRRPRPRRRHHCGVASCHFGSRWPDRRPEGLCE